MPKASNLTYERVARAVRLCHTTRQAANMLGCQPSSFLRSTRRHGIDWPKK